MYYVLCILIKIFLIILKNILLTTKMTTIIGNMIIMVVIIQSEIDMRLYDPMGLTSLVREFETNNIRCLDELPISSHHESIITGKYMHNPSMSFQII